ARGLGEVAGILLERVVALFRAGAVGRAAAGRLLDRGFERLGIDVGRLERLAGGTGAEREGLEDALDRHEAVARLAGELLGLIEHAHGVVVEPRRRLRAAARDRRL